MKTQIIIAAGILFSTAGFAQSNASTSTSSRTANTTSAAAKGQKVDARNATDVKAEATGNVEFGRETSTLARQKKDELKAESREAVRATSTEVKENKAKLNEATKDNHGVTVSATAKTSSTSEIKGSEVKQTATLNHGATIKASPDVKPVRVNSPKANIRATTIGRAKVGLK